MAACMCAAIAVRAASGPTPLVLRPAEIEPFDRGTGVRTLPYVGKWNADHNKVTTGVTEFPAGAGIPLHTHNVEESVLILEGQATAVIGDDRFDLEPGDATWAPAGVPHRFANRGEGPMRIYWVYGDVRSPARSAPPARPSSTSRSGIAARR
jgi:HTH-type transcriptional repressor of puuD